MAFSFNPFRGLDRGLRSLGLASCALAFVLSASLSFTTLTLAWTAWRLAGSVLAPPAPTCKPDLQVRVVKESLITALPSPQLATWRLLARYAGPDAARLHRIAYVESRYCPDARNPRSGAAGLYQFMPRTWEWARAGAGLPPDASPYDPVHATVAAAWALSQPGGTKLWRTR